MTTLYMDSLGLVAEIRGLLPTIMRRDHDLARKLKRATDELSEHLADGMCVTGRARRREYDAADLAAQEAQACLTAALGVGYLPDGDTGLVERFQGVRARLAEVRKAA